MELALRSTYYSRLQMPVTVIDMLTSSLISLEAIDIAIDYKFSDTFIQSLTN